MDDRPGQRVPAKERIAAAARRVCASRAALLAGLVLLAALPRLFMAGKIGSLCPDGVVYIRLAGALESGDWRGGLDEMNVNTFTLALAALHHLGLDWEMAAKIWGVGMASLAVLPLYGWLRRQFDSNVAIGACVLYACHRQLIRWSPEVLRDPTFWFFFVLSLYLSWRASHEGQPWQFVAAGAAIVLAVLTRFEGLLLLLPLSYWSVERAYVSPRLRRRLLLGFGTAVAVFPCVALLVNLTWLRDEPRWLMSRVRPWELVHAWAISAASPERLASEHPDIAQLTAGKDRSLVRAVSIYVPVLVKGYTPFFAFWMLAGLWSWPRVWLWGDHLPLTVLSLALIAAVWVQVWVVHESSPRYLLPLVMMGTPFASMGIRAGSARLVGPDGAAVWRRWAGLLPWAVVMTVGLVGAFTSRDFEKREALAQLGRWIVEQSTSHPDILGTRGAVEVVNYYAGGTCRAFPTSTSEEMVAKMAQLGPTRFVVLVPTSQMDATRCGALSHRLEAQGFGLVPPYRLPPGCRSMFVLARSGPLHSSAHRAQVHPL